MVVVAAAWVGMEEVEEVVEDVVADVAAVPHPVTGSALTIVVRAPAAVRRLRRMAEVDITGDRTRMMPRRLRVP